MDFILLMDELQEKMLENGSFLSKIVVLEVSGIIQDNGDLSSLFGLDGYNYRMFLKNFECVKDDKMVKGIVLKVNFLGGGVYESVEIYKKLEEIKKEIKKLIYVLMGLMVVFGGYYILMVVDKIFVILEILIGLFGVIMESVNYLKFVDKFGIFFEMIKSGVYKDIMFFFCVMMKEEKNIM